MGLYCMGKLKNVRVIRDVQNELRSRFIDYESKNNLALAILAMNLNLFQEAEELFKLSNQNLKLVEYYQSRNNWSIALKTIGKLNERSVFYDCGKYYENELNDLENSIKYYEKSSCNHFEVTRMLFDINELGKLKQYCFNGKLISNNKNKSNEETNETSKLELNSEERIKLNNLKRWWAQYCESLGDFQSSLKSYEQAKDYYNRVRLLCQMGNLEEAKKVVNLNENTFKISSSSYMNSDNNTIIMDNNDDLNFLNKHNKTIDEDELERQSKNAALLQLGKHLEQIEPVESVQYYLNSGAINHAIRLCKSNQFEEQLVKIIQNYGSRNEIIDLIKKLDENEDNYENLFHLYLKIEMIDKCLKIGFKGRLWSNLRQFLNNYLDKIHKTNEEQIEVLEKINKIEIDQISNQISDETIELALEYLKNNSQIIDILINLLLIKGTHKNLIKDLILDYKIDINNELIDKIEKLFNENNNNNNNNSETNSQSLLQSLAESALIQGSKYIL